MGLFLLIFQYNLWNGAMNTGIFLFFCFNSDWNNLVALVKPRRPWLLEVHVLLKGFKIPGPPMQFTYKKILMWENFDVSAVCLLLLFFGNWKHLWMNAFIVTGSKKAFYHSQEEKIWTKWIVWVFRDIQWKVTERDLEKSRMTELFVVMGKYDYNLIKVFIIFKEFYRKM